MQMIVAVTNNWGIGYRDQLLFHIPEDLKRFKRLTVGHSVLMGRKTWESLPKALPDRKNIVLTSNTTFRPDGASVIHNLTDICPQHWNGFCIGGASLYEQCLKYCDKIYVTHILTTIPADTYFPDLTKYPEWQCTKISQTYHHQNIAYRFAIYQKKANP